MASAFHQILTWLARDTVNKRIVDRWPVSIDEVRDTLNAEMNYDLWADMYQNSRGYVSCNVGKDYHVRIDYQDGSVGRSSTSIAGSGTLKPIRGGCSLEIEYELSHFSLTHGLLILWMLVIILLGVRNVRADILTGHIVTGALIFALHLGFAALGFLIRQQMKSEISSLHLRLSNTVFSRLAS